jgi:uncharacterized membrane protein YccC
MSNFNFMVILGEF